MRNFGLAMYMSATADGHLHQLCCTCAAVSVLVQLVTGGTLAAEAPRLVRAVVLAVAIVDGALVDVCEGGQ